MRFICFLSLVVVSLNSHAICTGNTCQDVTVDRIFMYPDGSSVRVGTSGDETGLDCTANGDKYITLDMTQDFAKEAYSTILAAHQARNKFWIRTTGDGTDCSVVYIVSVK